MVKLVDTHVSGACGSNAVGVRLPPSALEKIHSELIHSELVYFLFPFSTNLGAFYPKRFPILPSNRLWSSHIEAELFFRSREG